MKLTSRLDPMQRDTTISEGKMSLKVITMTSHLSLFLPHIRSAIVQGSKKDKTKFHNQLST